MSRSQECLLSFEVYNLHLSLRLVRAGEDASLFVVRNRAEALGIRASVDSFNQLQVREFVNVDSVLEDYNYSGGKGQWELTCPFAASLPSQKT